MQEKKPSTPHTAPDKALRKLLKEREKEEEEVEGEEKLMPRKI